MLYHFYRLTKRHHRRQLRKVNNLIQLLIYCYIGWVHSDWLVRLSRRFLNNLTPILGIRQLFSEWNPGFVCLKQNISSLLIPLLFHLQLPPEVNHILQRVFKYQRLLILRVNSKQAFQLPQRCLVTLLLLIGQRILHQLLYPSIPINLHLLSKLVLCLYCRLTLSFFILLSLLALLAGYLFFKTR